MTFTSWGAKRGRFHIVVTDDVDWSALMSNAADYEIKLLDTPLGIIGGNLFDLESSISYYDGFSTVGCERCKARRTFLANLKDRFAREFPEWRLVIGDEPKLSRQSHSWEYPVSIQWEGIKDEHYPQETQGVVLGT